MQAKNQLCLRLNTINSHTITFLLLFVHGAKAKKKNIILSVREMQAALADRRAKPVVLLQQTDVETFHAIMFRYATLPLLLLIYVISLQTRSFSFHCVWHILFVGFLLLF